MKNAIDKDLKNKNWTFQQDEATAHIAKITQNFCRKNFPRFWNKKYANPCSPDFNPMDFSIWEILDKAATHKSHKTIDSLKKSLKKAWKEIPLFLLRAADDQAIKRFSNVCEKFGGLVEK